MRFVNVLLIATLATVSCLHGQVARYLRVKVVVAIDEKEFRDEVQSYLERELRSLGDVDVVEDRPRFLRL